MCFPVFKLLSSRFQRKQPLNRVKDVIGGPCRAIFNHQRPVPATVHAVFNILIQGSCYLGHGDSYLKQNRSEPSHCEHVYSGQWSQFKLAPLSLIKSSLK